MGFCGLADPERPDSTPVHSGVKFEFVTVRNMNFVVAEALLIDGRLHKRIIGYSHTTSGPLHVSTIGVTV